MDIGYHRADIPCAVRAFAGGGEFDAVEVGGDGWVEVHGVALVEGVYLAAGGDSDLRGFGWVGGDKIGCKCL